MKEARFSAGLGPAHTWLGEWDGENVVWCGMGDKKASFPVGDSAFRPLLPEGERAGWASTNGYGMGSPTDMAGCLEGAFWGWLEGRMTEHVRRAMIADCE
jgi:hypothetical protein